MFKDRDREIFDLLKADHLIDPGKLVWSMKEAFKQVRPISDILIESELIGRDELLALIAKTLELTLLETNRSFPLGSDEISSRVPRKFAITHGVLLIDEDEETCHVAVMDPFDHETKMDLAHLLGKPIHLYLGDPRWIENRISDCYSDFAEMIQEVHEFSETVDREWKADTLIVYVDTLLRKAIQEGASDIHFEPFEHCFRIRYRVDGALREIPSQVNQLGDAIVSRIKVLARLNISETRVPQDGRMPLQVFGRVVDIRVSTLPTQFGESVVLRILDKSKVNLDLDMLGIPEDLLLPLRNAIHQPNGIFLATGPTGSGKTTTLYSALSELNQPGSKLLTVEDPVEYDIDGIIQVQTHHLIGLDFSRVLRAFLRHDPDKILLGEIRDTESAKIAVQASLTGHMVFSSLHTNDATGAINRFVDMGVEPYLVAASLVAVLAQRLLRRLNLDACEAYAPSDEELAQLECSQESSPGKLFYRPRRDEGYRGRVGLFELLVVNDRFREAITRMSSHGELCRIARENGMRTLRTDGIRALFEGVTSVPEVLRYT